jgi:hypothetical protein
MQPSEEDGESWEQSDNEGQSRRVTIAEEGEEFGNLSEELGNESDGNTGKVMEVKQAGQKKKKKHGMNATKLFQQQKLNFSQEAPSAQCSEGGPQDAK